MSDNLREAARAVVDRYYNGQVFEAAEMQALRSALSAPEGEPVAVVVIRPDRAVWEHGRVISWLRNPGYLADGARLYLAAPPCAAQWQPIETAPKGKKLILGYWNELGKWRTVMGHYWLKDTLESDHTESGFADEGWYEATEAYEELAPLDCEPTHYQPLPTPPKGAGE